MKIRYVLKNKNTGNIEYKACDIKRIELGGITHFFQKEEWEVIGRDRSSEVKDITGKEIYERDVMQLHSGENKYTVKFRLGCFYLTCPGLPWISLQSGAGPSRGKVIGTVYDKDGNEEKS
jgi:hypothetical protein